MVIEIGLIEKLSMPAYVLFRTVVMILLLKEKQEVQIEWPVMLRRS